MKSPGSYALYKVKDDKLDQWLAWCEAINSSRRQEAVSTLSGEGVAYELFATFQLEDAWYSLGATINDSQATRGNADPDLAINVEHRSQKRECLEPVTRGEFSYLLRACSRSFLLKCSHVAGS